MKNKKGNIVIVAVLLILGIAIIAGAAYFYLNKTKTTYNPPQQTQRTIVIPSPGSSSENIAKFDASKIIKTESFLDSQGKNKKVIAYNLATEGVSTTEFYITDADLSVDSAVKIQSQQALAEIDFFVSPEPTSKFILISTTPGAVPPEFLLVNESGKLISSDIRTLAYELVKDNCQCNITFDKWEGTGFYLKAVTANGNFRLLFDATTGQPIGTAKPI